MTVNDVFKKLTAEMIMRKFHDGSAFQPLYENMVSSGGLRRELEIARQEGLLSTSEQLGFLSLPLSVPVREIDFEDIHFGLQMEDLDVC